MDESPDPAPELRWLKTLVTVLTVVMIGGVLTITALLVMRLRSEPPALPSEIALPDGAAATAFTQGPDWYAIVTDGGEILIYDRLTGELRQRVTVTP